MKRRRGLSFPTNWVTKHIGGIHIIVERDLQHLLGTSFSCLAVLDISYRVAPESSALSIFGGIGRRFRPIRMRFVHTYRRLSGTANYWDVPAARRSGSFHEATPV